MRRTAPGRRRGKALGGLIMVTALALIGAGKKRSEPPPPKVEETVNELAYIVSNGEIKLEGVGLVFGLDDTGRRPASGVLSLESRRRDAQGGGREREPDTQGQAVLAGDRPGAGFRPGSRPPTGSTSRSSCRRVRHQEPGRGLPPPDAAPRGVDRRRDAQGRERPGRCAGAGDDRQYGRAEQREDRARPGLGPREEAAAVQSGHQGQPPERTDLESA